MHMIYEYWLAAVSGVPSGRKRQLRELAGNAEAAYYMEEKELRASGLLKEREIQAFLLAKKNPFREEYERMRKQEIHFVPYFAGEYPKRLCCIQNPPYAIYVKGALPEEGQVSAAIVGARKCTPYGEQMSLAYGEAFARAGVQVISGMARGIDGAGQRGALNGGGKSFGILGCGADICYPREHFGLYMDLQQSGGIISEQLPGTKPFPGFFPARNRIISALSDVVLVMEAREKSGSLITADMALEQGKDVYALPGPATSPLSQGCHHLIREGAGILVSPEVLLEEMSLCSEKVGQIINKNEKMLETTENLVYSCLDFTPRGVNGLSERTGLPARKVLELLISLELKGMVKEISKNYYIRT